VRFTLIIEGVPRPTPEEIECCRALFITDPEEDLLRLKRRKGGHVPGTCDWIMDTEQLNLWLGDSSQTDVRPSIFWLHGNPGVGKSTITIAMTEILQSRSCFQSNEKTLAYFFCESSSDKHTSATSILRGLLHQLVHKHPEWVRFLMPKYLVRKEKLFTSFEALWSILLAIAKEFGEIYCIIDALDECTRDSQETLLAQLAETFDEGSEGPDGLGLHILVTSRPYEEIGRHLRQFYHHDLSSFPSLRHDVDLLIEKKVDELSRRNTYPQSIRQDVAGILKDKADGTSLWVGIACRELLHVPSKNAVKTLERLPRNLDSLYTTLLESAKDHAPDEYETVVRILGVVAIALRPLTILELSQFAQIYLDQDQDVRHSFTRDTIHMCRLLIVVQDETVTLLHKSLKDFLLRGKQRVVEESPAHAQAAYRCLDLVIASFKDFDIYKYTQESDSFLFYSALYWSQHAYLGHDDFSILQRHSIFFEPQSQVRDAWRAFDSYHQLSHWTYYNLHSLFELAGQWKILPLVNYILAGLGNTHALQNLLESSARNGDTRMFSFLLDQPLAIVKTSVIMAALQNDINGREIIKIILSRRGVRNLITESIIDRAAECGNIELLQWYITWRGAEFALSQRLLYGIVSGSDKGLVLEIMSQILRHSSGKPIFTEEHMKTAARYGDPAVIALLVDYPAVEPLITEDVVQQALLNPRGSWKTVRLFWNCLGDQLPVSVDLDFFPHEDDFDEMVEMFEIILDLLGDKVPILYHLWDCSATYRADVLSILLEKRPALAFTKDMLSTAVEANDEALLTLILARSSTCELIDQEFMTFAASHGSARTIELILDHVSGITIAEETVLAAAANGEHGVELIELLVRYLGDDFRVTSGLLETAVAKGLWGPKIIHWLELLDSDSVGLVELLSKSAAYYTRVALVKHLYSLVDRNPLRRDELTMTVFEYGSIETISAICEQVLTDYHVIPEDLILAVIHNYAENNVIFQMLVDQRWNIPVTEDIVIAAGQFEYSRVDLQVIIYQLIMKGNDTSPTLVRMAAFYAVANEHQAASILRGPEKILLIEDVLAQIAIAGNARTFQFLFHAQPSKLRSSAEWLKLLPLRVWIDISAPLEAFLCQRHGVSWLSAEVLEVMSCYREYTEVVGAVLTHPDSQIAITDELIIRCARRCRHDTLLLILQRGNPTFDSQFCQNLIDSVVQNRLYGEDIIHTLQQLYPAMNLLITERTAMLIAYCGNWEPVEALLQYPEDKVMVTREALFAAANDSEDLLGIFLSRANGDLVTREGIVSAVGSPGDELMIQRVLRAAATSSHSPEQGDFAAFKAVFHRLAGSSSADDALIRASMRNWQSTAVLWFLIDTAGDSFRLTEDIMVDAADHAPEALEYLLHRFDPCVPITEKVLEAAAGADESDALRLILPRANHLAITPTMMEAMFYRSRGFGRFIWETAAEEKLEFMCASGKAIPITEDILIAAAGHKVADVLARQYPNEVKLCLTDRVLLATAASSHSSLKTLKLYERRFGCQITERLRLVYRLGAAVRDKHLWAVQRLLEQGAPPDTADFDLRTPLHHAACGHRESIVEALLQTQSVDINATDFRGETPLLDAVRTGDSTIVRILLTAGADPNAVNSRGQTAWSIAEERVYLRIMRTLEEFGADTNLASCEIGLELRDDR
jgi:hypothetical protein